MARQSWLDEDSNEVKIDDYAQRLTSFMDAMADGRIDDAELAAQEASLAALMKAIEPTLDDETHAKITQLLCETSAFSIMQFLHQMQNARASAVSQLNL